MPQNDGTVEEPVNREPEPAKLVEHFLTPTTTAEGSGYDRNHGPIIHLDPSTHTIDIKFDHSLEVKSPPKPLNVTHLQTLFSQHSVTCALQCAGNRRHAMRTRVKEVSGIDWFDGAILNAEWEGPLLRDVLVWGGIEDLLQGAKRQPDELHVQLACNATETQEDSWYGGSISLERAIDPEMEVVLALKMNNELLTVSHGAPVRAVVPGIIGARSVKWLDTITISPYPSPNHYQTHDYKILPPHIHSMSDATDAIWSSVPPMMDNPINSVVALPESDSTATLHNNTLQIRGYAVPGGSGGPVTKVEVAVAYAGQDAKEVQWVEAELGEATRWSWVLWEARMQGVRKGEEVRIFSRATDRADNRMDEEKSEWNIRGIGYNGYEGSVGVKIV